MLFNLSKVEHIYIAPNYVDFRKATNGLVAIISDHLLLNPCMSAMFLFTNKRRTSIKIIYYETNGFWLFQKTLLNHDKFQWPKQMETNVTTIDKLQFEWLLRGMDITPKHEFKVVESMINS